MNNRVISICADDPSVTLTAYVADEGWKKRDAMLVIPGGGYGVVCDDREGEPIALAFLARGVNAFVLKYSVGEKAKFPRPLCEASVAMAYIKDHAEEFHVDADRVFCVGFSAGGHLAASLGTFWHLPAATEATGHPYGYNKPRGTVLCYPVITGFEKAHKDSFYNLLGTSAPTEEELALYSVEKHIDERSAPAFLMHTSDDGLVPVENSLYAAEAFAASKVPFEMHIYPHGPHGVALGDWQTARGMAGYDNPAIARWVEDAVRWMKGV